MVCCYFISGLANILKGEIFDSLFEVNASEEELQFSRSRKTITITSWKRACDLFGEPLLMRSVNKTHPEAFSAASPSGTLKEDYDLVDTSGIVSVEWLLFD